MYLYLPQNNITVATSFFTGLSTSFRTVWNPVNLSVFSKTGKGCRAQDLILKK